jgi:hypothetical protein
MQFNNIALLATALMGMAIASPTVSEITRSADNAVVVSVNGRTFLPFYTRSQENKTNLKTHPEALSPDVSISCVLNCAEVLGSAACIAVGIAEGNVDAVKACGSFGVSKVDIKSSVRVKIRETDLWIIALQLWHLHPAPWSFLDRAWCLLNCHF